MVLLFLPSSNLLSLIWWVMGKCRLFLSGCSYLRGLIMQGPILSLLISFSFLMRFLLVCTLENKDSLTVLRARILWLGSVVAGDDLFQFPNGGTLFYTEVLVEPSIMSLPVLDDSASAEGLGKAAHKKQFSSTFSNRSLIRNTRFQPDLPSPLILPLIWCLVALQAQIGDLFSTQETKEEMRYLTSLSRKVLVINQRWACKFSILRWERGCAHCAVFWKKMPCATYHSSIPQVFAHV